jgi:hypothetical protein
VFNLVSVREQPAWLILRLASLSRAHARAFAACATALTSGDCGSTVFGFSEIS